MPDRDIFTRRAVRGWATPLRHLCGRSEPDIIAKKTLRALTKTLKNRGGIPGSAAICRLLEDFSSRRISLEVVLNRLRREGLTRGDHLTVALGLRATQQLLIKMANDSAGTALDIPHALGVQYCRSLVEANLFGCAPDLVGKRFPDVGELQEFANRVFGEMSPGIESIAQQLVTDATARTLKQPRSVFRHTRRRTSDLLHEPVT